MSTDPGWPHGHDLIELHEVDSTNAYAARGVRSFLRPTWIRADQQTAGRGRSGRSWRGQTGNLFATLIYRPEASAQNAALRSFVAANALHAALCETTDPANLALKWPNDVLFRGGKIAGILLESETKGRDVDWLAIGIGVNLASAPEPDPDVAFLPVCLDATIAPGEFLKRLATHFAREEGEFTKYGFAPIRERWLAHAAHLGEAITARTATETIHGTFVTVDETGNLRLDTAKGPRMITAADVYFA